MSKRRFLVDATDPNIRPGPWESTTETTTEPGPFGTQTRVKRTTNRALNLSPEEKAWRRELDRLEELSKADQKAGQTSRTAADEYRQEAKTDKEERYAAYRIRFNKVSLHNPSEKREWIVKQIAVEFRVNVRTIRRALKEEK